MDLLPVGVAAPSFTLKATPDQELSLEEFRGKNLVICFYPADWSPVCGDEFSLYNEVLSIIHSRNAELLWISVDGAWCHQAFRRDRKP